MTFNSTEKVNQIICQYIQYNTVTYDIAHYIAVSFDVLTHPLTRLPTVCVWILLTLNPKNLTVFPIKIIGFSRSMSGKQVSIHICM